MGFGRISGFLFGLVLALVLSLASALCIAEQLAGVQAPPASATIDANAVPAILTGEDLLRQARQLLIQDEFDQARELLAGSLNLPEYDLQRLDIWLDSYREFIAQRRFRREETAGNHVTEARSYLKEKKFEEALASTYLAAMASPELEALRGEDWLDELVQLCAARARKFSEEGQYGKAAVILSEISRIFEDDPLWKQRLKDAGQHAGMLGAYDHDSNWERRLEEAKISHFENAVHVVDEHFVKPVDYRKMLLGSLKGYRYFLTTKGLDKSFEGLAKKYVVISLVNFLDKKIELITSTPHVTAADLVQTYYQIVQKNRQTLKLPDPVLVDLLINQACQAIDDYTEMIWPEQQRWFIRSTTGSFSGIGVQIRSNQAKQLEVVTPLVGTPAFKAGLEAGDLIVAVDGKNTEGVSVDEAVRLITGKRGTMVTLTVRRPGRADVFDVPIVRDIIKIKSVLGYSRLPDHTWNYIVDTDAGIAYLRISNFMQNTVEELDRALEACRAQGAKALIVDLRFDPGGTLRSAEEVSDQFLKPGQLIVTTRGLSAKPYTAKARKPEACPGWPVIILTSDKSASASEIVAGALQDHKRAIVVGERTFGKGLVQRPFRLGVWSDSQVTIKVTTAYWYLPEGRNVQRSEDSETWGVEPDFAVGLTPDEFRSLRIRWVNADIIRNSNNGDETESKEDSASGSEELQSTESTKPDAESEASEDFQATTGPDDSTKAEEPDVPDPQLETALLLARLELMVRGR